MTQKTGYLTQFCHLIAPTPNEITVLECVLSDYTSIFYDFLNLGLRRKVILQSKGEKRCIRMHRFLEQSDQKEITLHGIEPINLSIRFAGLRTAPLAPS